jgi:hypothetical protein
MFILIGVLLIILATAWAQYRNGLFSSFAMLFKVLVSGLVAFNFFEPIANSLEPSFQGNALVGMEDFFALIGVFSVTLLVLRVVTNRLAPEMIEENGKLQFLGASGVGFITGYFVAGFLVCAMETLPLDEQFLDFEPRTASEKPSRSVYPPDRVWIALMRHAGAVPLSWKEDPNAEVPQDRYMTFDRFGTFELRYARYRRSTETRPPMRYQGEFDVELGKQKKK